MVDDGRVVMVGAGGHARVVADALLPRRVIGHLAPGSGDHRAEASLGERLGDDDDAQRLAEAGCTFALGIGYADRDGASRRAGILEALRDCEFESIVHPRSIVSPSAQVRTGSFVGPGAMVGVGVRVGNAVIVNSGAIVDHDCRIGTNVHVAPGAVISGGVTIGDDTLIGAGATVRQRLTIGSRVVVGAGAVVVADVSDGETVVGVPARSRASE